MKLNDAINYLNSQPMFKEPISRDYYRFLSNSQFDKLVAAGTIKSVEKTVASAKTNWKLMPVTEYYV